ncbi:hypoxia up-regulated protein 1 isoform X2 [Hyalella azteca]|uniref:Hypoxia up-regulated protein 1 n=1 Tax=Hyalella azteca TaxID=294128 RepID=A0A8B7PNM1_HYAAZ|nr:hypoxia up-regulated protein 1 isoform X2 [Hyalella azteca]
MPISSRELVCYLAMYGIVLALLFRPGCHPTDYQKVAVVVPKMPMEMDRNGDGPVAIGTLDGKRIGTITAGMRLLSSALDGNILQLLGKPVDHPTVKAYMKAHPFYNILPHPERETVIFRTSDERSLNVEELVAYVLQEVKKQVSALTGQQVQEVIFPVPASFNQPERRALLEAVEIAGVKARNMSELMMATRRLPESPSWFSDDHLENMDHLLVCTQMMLVVPDVTEPDDCPADVQCVVTVVAESDANTPLEGQLPAPLPDIPGWSTRVQVPNSRARRSVCGKTPGPGVWS